MLAKPAHDFAAGLMSAVNGIVRTKVTGVKITHKNVLIVKQQKIEHMVKLFKKHITAKLAVNNKKCIKKHGSN